ncbi:MAG: hypothetical protein HYU66_05020 [Armatimonadetes bacterium]|nr:hypothetical protein [Armatimonadota bacterium]
MPSIPFTTQRLIRRYQVDQRRPATRAEVAGRFAGPRRVLLITRSRHRRLLNGVTPCYDWAERLGYLLVGNQPPPAGFVLPPSPWTEAGLASREEPHGR